MHVSRFFLNDREDLHVVVVFKSNDLKQVDDTEKKQEILIFQMMDETGVLVNGEAWRQNAKHYNQLLEVNWVEMVVKAL